MITPLSWTGSKRWQAARIIDLLDRKYHHTRLNYPCFVELFAGSAAISLAAEFREVHLNDINFRLMNFWEHVQRGATLHTSVFLPEDYLQIRERFNDSSTWKSLLGAEYFLALNKWAFSSIYRENSRGEFNVPARPHRRPLEDLVTLPYAKVMELWTLSTGPWDHVNLEPSDFVYADPPYDDTFGSYSKSGFSWSDQQALAGFLSIHPGPVVLMNNATQRIQELYARLGFHMELIHAPQHMHQGHGETGPVLEMMATRNL